MKNEKWKKEKRKKKEKGDAFFTFNANEKNNKAMKSTDLGVILVTHGEEVNSPLPWDNNMGQATSQKQVS